MYNHLSSEEIFFKVTITLSIVCSVNLKKKNVAPRMDSDEHYYGESEWAFFFWKSLSLVFLVYCLHHSMTQTFTTPSTSLVLVVSNGRVEFRCSRKEALKQ